MNNRVVGILKKFLNKTKNLSVKRIPLFKSCYFIKLPFAIGDNVYTINYQLWNVKMLRVDSMVWGNLDNDTLGVLSVVTDDCSYWESYNGSYFEKSEDYSELFKTRKEAEGALKEREKDYFNGLSPEEKDEELEMLAYRRRHMAEVNSLSRKRLTRLKSIFERCKL